MKHSSFTQVFTRQNRRAGFTITELLTLIAAVVVALCLVIPAIGSVKSPSRVDQSLANLRTLFAAHQAYANDWAGRQVTFAVDGLGAYGHLAAYHAATGSIHPPIVLGWGCAQENGSSLWRYDFSGPANSLLLYPIASNQRYGNFRLVNAKPLNSYVNGKIFEPTYFAPADGIVLNKVTPYFAQPCEMPNGIGSLFPWSSYCFSPAGFYDPITHDRKHPNYPGPGQPIPTSLQAPAIAAARYPDLKTHILEHNWLQNAPIWCNPNFRMAHIVRPASPIISITPLSVSLPPYSTMVTPVSCRIQNVSQAMRLSSSRPRPWTGSGSARAVR